MTNFIIETCFEEKAWKNKRQFQKEIQKNKYFKEYCANLSQLFSLKELNQLIVQEVFNELNIAARIQKSKNQKAKIVISLLLTNNKKIKQLNHEFREKNQETNVLSFAYQESDFLDKLFLNKENEIFLGDIIISFEKLFFEATEQKINFIDHYAHLFIHGILHLFGFDHENCSEETAQKMENLEAHILSKFNIENPYI